MILSKHPEETLSCTEKTLRNTEIGPQGTEKTLSGPEVHTEGTGGSPERP